MNIFHFYFTNFSAVYSAQHKPQVKPRKVRNKQKFELTNQFSVKNTQMGYFRTITKFVLSVFELSEIHCIYLSFKQRYSRLYFLLSSTTKCQFKERILILNNFYWDFVTVIIEISDILIGIHYCGNYLLKIRR